jgi:pre-mRNA-processing factor 6
VDPEQFQDPDNEYGLFAGTTYEADDEEADKIYEEVDKNMDARRRARRFAKTFDVSLLLYSPTFLQGSPGRS